MEEGGLNLIPMVAGDVGVSALNDEDEDEEEEAEVPLLRMLSPEKEIMPDQPSCDSRSTISGVSFFHAGSINGSVPNLCAAAIGTGSLNIPFAMTIGGLGVGVAFIIGGAIACIWSLYLLLATARACKTRNLNLTVTRSAGPAFATLLDAAILGTYFGYVIVFQIITTSMMTTILGQIGFDQSSIAEYDWLQTLLVATLILFPLCLLKDMGALNIGSFLLIIAIVYTALIILIEFPFYYSANHKQNEIVWYVLDWDMFDTFAYTIFAYECHSIFFLIYAELGKPTKRRTKKVIKRATFLNMGIYLVVSIFGYLSTFGKTPHVVANRESLRYFGSPDYMMLLGQIAVYVSLILSVPVNYAAIRRSLFNYIWGPREMITNPNNIFVTMVILGLTTGLAILFPKLRSMISLVGGIGDVIIVFIVPVACYLSKIPTSRCMYWMYILIGLAGSMMGFIAVATTVISILQGTAT